MICTHFDDFKQHKKCRKTIFNKPDSDEDIYEWEIKIFDLTT